MLPELLTEQIEENIKIQKELKAATRRLIKVIENHDKIITILEENAVIDGDKSYTINW